MKSSPAIGIIWFVVLIAIAGTWYWFGKANLPKNLAVDYKNATYVIDGKAVTLKDGVSEIKTAPGSASKLVTRYFGNNAKGDINGDGIPDLAFILTQSGGGSGTFYYVAAAVQDTSGGYRGTDAILLGDRIAPQTTEIRDGQVIVNYAERAPGESFATSPSVGKSIWLKLDPKTMQFGEVVKVEDLQYSNTQYGISFLYPSTYVLSEMEAPGSGMRTHHVITLMLKEDLPLPVGGEGPPAITIDVYQNNLDKQTALGWIRNTSQSNFKLGDGTFATTTISGLPATSYRWSGLYEGTTIVIAKTQWIYALTVTYLEMGAPIIQDFVKIKGSIRITE